MRNVLKKKGLSLLESVMAGSLDAWNHLLMTEEPSPAQVEEFNVVCQQWSQLESNSNPCEDELDSFVKTILQTRKLNEEICKLVIFLTSKHI